MTRSEDEPRPRAAELDEAHAAALVNATPEPLLLLDTEGRILLANEAFLRRFEMTRQEAVGGVVYDAFPDTVAAVRRAALEEAVRTRESVAIEDERDGHHFEIRIHPLVGPDGEVDRLAVFTRDITEKHIAQQSLRDGEARLRVITESLPIPIWVSRMEDGRILFANEGLHAALGLPNGSLVGKATPDLYENAGDRAAFLAELQREGRVRHREVPIRLPDGERRIIWASADVIELDGKPAMMGAFVDVTDRRAVEADLSRLQKTEAIGRLAGGIAHDFNNLLTAIEGCSAFAQSTLAETHPAYADIGEIRDAGRRAAALTRQLLAYSKRQVLQPVAVDLNGVVEEMQSLLARIIGEDVHFATRLTRPLPAVWIDPSQLEQVLVNLIVNARDAMPHGGTVTVETSVVGPKTDADAAGLAGARSVRLTVRDTGTGMDDATRARIFEPFFTTKAVDKGTGLGLSTVQGIVEQSGGSVVVDSTPGDGSAFHVFLRVSDRAGRARPEPGERQEATTQESGTILLVEDEPLIRRLTERMLRGFGYSVLAAADGRRAIELASEGVAIDLLLTDVVMPEMGGEALARQMWSERPDLKVLYMSGYSESVLADRERDVRLLHKPFDSEQLRTAVRQALGHASSADPR